MYRSTMFLIIVSIISLCAHLFAQERNDQDKTLSPYFLVTGDAKGNFPLLSTSADIQIAGVIADVTVKQVYKNDGSEPIEAIYVFPASTRAAVYALKMTLDDRVIDAEVKERQKARIEYENARQEGKSASLLEQQRPNVFQMNVANILPGDTINVELRYTELLVPENNVYELVYPTVVGPRYSNVKESEEKESEKWVQNPYLHQGQQPTYSFDIHVGIQAGMPVQDMACPTHKVNIHYDSPSLALVALDKSEADGGNRDFILNYRLAGNQIESGMLLYKGDDENFFCIMVQPPQRITNEHIPPREYIFVVDVSGSMNGFPLDITKELLKKLISSLRPTDCFNVVLFAGVSNIMSERSLPANKENINRAIQVINRQQGSGGTELLPALKRSLTLPRDEGVSRSIVVITDGYVSVEKEAFDLIRNNLNKANLFAFGIGSSVNRILIEGMARVGGGEPFVITSTDNAAEMADKFKTYIQNPVLTQIGYSFDGFSVYDVEPVTIPDVLASRPVIIYGKWKGKLSGRAKITGYTGEMQPYEQIIDIRNYQASEKNSALRYLWARNRIMLLDDYNNLQHDDNRVGEVTSLGLKYNLLTAYTSFVAIDNETRNTSGRQTTIKQPLPLPMGVSDYAIGQGASSLAVKGQRTPLRKNYAVPVKTKSQAPESSAFDATMEERSESEKKERITGNAGISLTDPARVTVNGKTIFYFWNSTVAGALSEIGTMIHFAHNNPGISIVIINTDSHETKNVELMLGQVTAKNTIPSNITFVHDPRKTLMSHASGGIGSESKPVILFMVNGATVKQRNDHLNIWNNSAKVLALFK